MQPDSPPPPYANKAQGTQAGSVPYPPPHPFNGSHAEGPFATPPRPRSPYGPTPIGLRSPEGVGILPYYNPQAFHTQELFVEAESRARWRFFGAFMWAVFIWVLVGALTGTAVVESRAMRRP
ncbi:hypothetical protein BDV93DRAFT_519690 [Ceratobasidium sp. AG-I]|nr:hypothetical protein BDV93DRAFT_519690 [Ceratobasidium sp. AG-I]